MLRYDYSLTPYTFKKVTCPLGGPQHGAPSRCLVGLWLCQPLPKRFRCSRDAAGLSDSPAGEWNKDSNVYVARGHSATQISCRTATNGIMEPLSHHPTGTKQITEQVPVRYLALQFSYKTQFGHKSCLLWSVDFLFRLPVGPRAVNTIDKETNGPALRTLTALQSLLKSPLSASVHRSPESGLSAELCLYRCSS